MPAFTLDIPFWHPATVNDLYAGHWTRRRKLKQVSRDVIAASAAHAKLPRATGKRRVTLLIVLKPRSRGGDVDDDPRHLELAPVQFERGAEAKWGSVILLEDL